MGPNKFKNTEVISLFYTRISELGATDQVFKCSCGVERKQKKGAGFSNLMSHLREKHEDWEDMFTKFQKENVKTKKAPNGNFFFVNPKAVQVTTP